MPDPEGPVTACSRPGVNAGVELVEHDGLAVVLDEPVDTDDGFGSGSWGRERLCLRDPRWRDLPGRGGDDDGAVDKLCRRLRPDPGPEQEFLRQPEPAAASDDDRVTGLALAGPLLGDSAVADTHDAVGDVRRLRVVAHEHRRTAVLAHELGQQLVDAAGGGTVELAGRLVGQEHLRPVRERGAERDPLLLAARQLARLSVSLLGEPDPVEQFVRAPQALGSGGAVQPELDRDQLARAELGRERARVVLVGVTEQRRAIAREPA